MSFKQNRNKLKIIQWKHKNIIPKQGCLTLIWWKKGNSVNGFYIKAELYGLDGFTLNNVFLEDNLQTIINEIKFQYNLDKLDVK